MTRATAPSRERIWSANNAGSAVATTGAVAGRVVDDPVSGAVGDVIDMVCWLPRQVGGRWSVVG